MIETLVLIIVLGLASYRLTRFFVWDSLIGMGSKEEVDPDTNRIVDVPVTPWGEKVYAFGYHAEDGDGFHRGDDRSFLRGKIGDLLGCPWCLGFHISWMVYALWTWSLPWQVESPQAWVLMTFAIAGVQGFVGSREDA